MDFMALNTIFWKGVRRFYQTLKRIHGTKEPLPDTIKYKVVQI